MADGLINLIWQVDQDGYDIVRRERPNFRVPLVKPRDDTIENAELIAALSQKPSVPTSGGTDALGNPRFIGGLVAMGQHLSWPWKHDAMDFIVPRNGTRKRYKVQLLESSIFIDLANSKQSSELQEGVREFVNKWGLPGHWNDEPVESFVKWRDAVIHALSLSPHDILRRFRGTNLGNLTAGFEVKRGNIQLNFQADTLRQFCALEVLQHRAGHIDIVECGGCNRFLPLNKVGRHKAYCGEKCKMVAYRRRRRANPAKERQSTISSSVTRQSRRVTKRIRI
jgi:hypothetical protein